MSEWISVEKEKPSSPWHVVFVTDGTCTCLARWIENPRDWYGDDLMEWDEDIQDEIPLDKEWHDSHWIFLREVGPFLGNDECMGFNGDKLSHWMPLPSIDSLEEKEVK